MCGPETPSNLPRIGARVDFVSRSSSRHLLGNLLFFNSSDADDSSRATHVRFSRSSEGAARSELELDHDESSVLVSIHITGDMTKPVEELGLPLQQFTLPVDQIINTDDDAEYDIALGESLSLIVGEGIIGRRVSMTKGSRLLGDGIVGYNSMPTVRSCL
ncbi:hypothetical protein QBC43DRAFT_308563 [Cladorrhinum sp. PSN259]|nr:hypothetical protein QBC43DRAFT_308563 [Cladorrhinum sp. PSN259]